jgi:hypothetical protein
VQSGRANVVGGREGIGCGWFICAPAWCRALFCPCQSTPGMFRESHNTRHGQSIQPAILCTDCI